MHKAIILFSSLLLTVSMRNSLLFCIGILHASTIWSAGLVQVENLTAIQDDDRIIFSYDLTGPPGTSAEVLMDIRVKGDAWKRPIGRLEGDYGPGVIVGKGRQIRWDALGDFPQGINAKLDYRIETRVEREVRPERELAAQLKQCEAHLQANRLTSGKGGTALKCYKAVLDKDPDNIEAKSGFNKVVTRYLEWAETNLKQGKLAKAKGYYDKAFMIEPEGKAVLALKVKIEEREAALLHKTEVAERAYQAELERRRLADADSHQQAAKRRKEEAERERVEREAKERRDGVLLAKDHEQKMVAIPGGCFQMGSPWNESGRIKDERQHRVCVEDFKIGKYEVTNREFRRFRSGHNSGHHKGNNLNGENQPVVKVTWYEAMAYAEWLSNQTGLHYRLPTEAEWEYAARANTTTARFWGDDPDMACRYANIRDRSYISGFPRNTGRKIHDCNDGAAVTATVGNYEANGFGLHDMLGNVYEWTCSEYDEGYRGSENHCLNKQSASGRKIVDRGGSWEAHGVYARSAFRWKLFPDWKKSAGLGFRIVQD